MSEEEKLMTTIWRVPDELWEKIEPILALLAQALEAKAHREPPEIKTRVPIKPKASNS